jgi:hypothetical protein
MEPILRDDLKTMRQRMLAELFASALHPERRYHAFHHVRAMWDAANWSGEANRLCCHSVIHAWGSA